jgi:cell fate regulator YaaT (PSP1 superfamily)
MGCGSCGTNGKDGKPSGCKSNGGCSSGGCNRLNVHNWLSDLPTAESQIYNVVEVSFNHGSRKDFYKNTQFLNFEKGDFVTVEGSVGFDVGAISLTGELVKLQMAKRGIKEDNEEVRKVMRMASADDVQKMDDAKAKEKDMLTRSRTAIAVLNLNMKLTEVELQADQKKATFFYIAEERVDYRELIKIYAAEFKVKVEMKQIGIRQEAAKVGGIGSCGRELCCSTWLTDFKGVSTVAARYQNLSINQTKLSGQCGRLKCCLNFELDTYMDLLKGFPENADKLELATGSAYLQKKDIFKNVMWYTLAGSNKQYPLTIDRAKEIKSLNQRGEKPQELGSIELEISKADAEMKDAYGDLTGAISLSTLEKADKSKRYGNKPRSGNNNSGGNNNNRGNAPKGNAPRNAPNGTNNPNNANQNAPVANKPKPQISAPPKPSAQAGKPTLQATPSGNAPKPANPAPGPNTANPNANRPRTNHKPHGPKKPPTTQA